jgi:hypothetical protein
VPIQQEIEPEQLRIALLSVVKVYAAPVQAAKNWLGGPVGLLSFMVLMQIRPSISSSHVIPG